MNDPIKMPVSVLILEKNSRPAMVTMGLIFRSISIQSNSALSPVSDVVLITRSTGAHGFKKGGSERISLLEHFSSPSANTLTDY